MKHVYLNEVEIEKALDLGQVTLTEASQLKAQLVRCAKHNKRYGSVILHSII